MSLCAVAQRRQGDDLEAQPVEQIGAEAAFLDQAGQVLVGGGDDAHVDLERAARADPRHLAIFDRAQQPVLGGAGQSGELVEEERAAIGFLEAARPRLGGAGEGAGLVAEQFRLDQSLGQGRAVHDDQRPVPAGGQVVQALGDQLLAGAALADDEHRPVERRGAAGALDRVEEGGGLADELGVALHCRLLAHFTTCWQVLSACRASQNVGFWRISAISAIWHGPCLTNRVTPMGGGTGLQIRFRRPDMLSYDRFARVATALVGALVLSTLSITAAANPARAGTAGWIGDAQFKAPANV